MGTRIFKVLIALILQWGICSPMYAATELSLRHGDRVVFAGDSITAGGTRRNGFITLFKRIVERDHGKNYITIYNAGIPGDVAGQLMLRFDKTVLAKRPNIVIIYIGINDVWKREEKKGTPLEVYRNQVEFMALQAQKKGAKVLLCTPTIIGERTAGKNKLDSELDRSSECVKEIGQTLNVPVCDLRKGFQNFLAANNPLEWKEGLLTIDGVHLTDTGNRLVAQLMLASFGESP